MTKTAALIALIVLLAAANAYDTWKIFTFGGRISDDEHATCLIQKRGLEAQVYLTGVIGGIHDLLTLPPTSESRRQQAAIPPKRLRHELKIVRDLNANTFNYHWIESKQPRTRHCSQ